MSVTVRIPTPLRRITDGMKQVELDGTSVGECLKQLGENFPDINSQLMDDKGNLHRFVIIYLNGEDVRFLQGIETSTQPGDEINIVPAVAGG